MCGIAGVVSFSGAPVHTDQLASMSAMLRHRGPDDQGQWTGRNIGFAHRRLSVIDLSRSRQPMRSADGRWVLAFNGEIFNYKELRRSLDYPFRTDGDTETLLAGITRFGLGFVERLVGQFSFAVADLWSGSVHLVRDRLGILPLYYYVDQDCLIFGSEIKAVVAGLRKYPAVDLASLDDYLVGASVPAPHTLFAGISKLLPGHRADVGAAGEVRVERYWSLPEEDDPRAWTPGRVVDAVDDAVTEAVRAALVADVPVGAYLSGGVDSSLIAATVARLDPGRELHTFAAGFGDARHDELHWARRVSEHVGTTHHEIRVHAQEFENLWPLLTWYRDAPVSQPADIAVYRLAEAARQKVTVILSGEGGDELFAGYPKYQVARAAAFLSRVPSGVRATISHALERQLPEQLGRHRIALRVLAERTAVERRRAWFSPFTSRERTRLLNGLPQRVSRDGAGGDGDPVREMLCEDVTSWLPDNLLERGDRMSMAASLELRPPLMDHRLVELAFRLPSAYKVRRGTTKWALKEVARRVLPHDVVDRRKAGFRVPLSTWFRDGLRDSVRDRLTGQQSFVAETFDRATVVDLLDRHESGRFNEESRIFALMSLEVWHETFFRQAKPGHRPELSPLGESSGPAPSVEPDSPALGTVPT